MSRKKDSILNDLSVLPWKVVVIISVVVFISMRYIIPSIHIDNPLLGGIAKASPQLAPLFTILVLLAAAKSAFDSWRKGELLEKQRDIKSIKSISWQEFEELVGEVYRRKGYQVIECGGGGADGGVDLKLKKNGEVLLVQCKQWRVDSVGVKVAREIYGVVVSEGATGAIIISSGSATMEAKVFVKNKPIAIIEGPELYRMINEVQTNNILVGNSIKSKESILCPKCGGEMVLRTAKKGANAGNRFWGCMKYPKCTGVISV